MNNPTAQAISLSPEQVRQIVEDWLNTSLLRCPHTVTDIEGVDGQFNVCLAPRAEAPAPAPVTILPIPAPAPLVHTNGNGHHKAEDKTAPSAEAIKRQTRLLTPEEQTAIRSLRQSGIKPGAIANQIGLKVGTVYSYLERIGMPASRVTADEAAQHAV